MANPSTFRYVESPYKDIDNVLESTTDIEYLPERRRLFPEFSVISPSENTPPEDVDTREHLRVYARIKRVSGNSSEAVEESCVVVEGDGNLLLHVPNKNLSLKQGDRIEQTIQRYSFTHVYGPEVSQKEVFDNTVKPLVKEFLLGNNCLVFTYGVTNSGKTYTVQGTVKDGGLLPRTLDLLFNSLQGHVCSVPEYKPYRSSEVLHLDPRTIVEEQAAQSALLALAKKANRSLLDLDKTNGKSLTSTDGTLQESIMCGGPSQSLSELEGRKAISDCVSLEPSEKERSYSVWVAFYEIYNELIYDLLDFTPATRLAQRHILHMAEDQHKGPFIKDIKWVQVHNVIEVLTLLNAGRKNQSFASTKLNLNSSRSHSIFTIRLIRLEKGAKPEVTAINEFSICDLAGSERSSRTHNVADRLQEACNINTSLLALGKCITALRFNQQANRLNSRVVPFRESKLTRLFQVYFLGRGKTCMVVNINPSTSWYTENLNVLRFSAIAKQVLTHFPDRLGKRTQADCSSMIISADGVVPEKRVRAGANSTASVACARATIAKLVAAASAATAKAAVKPIQEAGGEGEGIDGDIDENCSEVDLDENDREMEVERLKEELKKEREDRKLDEWRIRGEISGHLQYLANLDEQQRKNDERTHEHMEDIWERRIKLLEEKWKQFHEREMRELQETFEADKDLVPIERLEAETEKLREKAELAEQQAKRILELEGTLAGLQRDVRALREAGEESRRQLELLPDSPAQTMDLGILKEANRELKVTLEEAEETFEKNRKEIKSLKQRSGKLEEELSTKDLLIEELRVSLASRDKQLSCKLSELVSLKATTEQLRGPAFGKTQAQATPSKPQWQGDLSTNRTHIPKSLPAIRPLAQRSHGNRHQCGSALENTQNVSPRLVQLLHEVQLQSGNKRGGAPGSEPAGCDDVRLSEALGDAERARADLREALEKASRLRAENSELLARCGQQEEHKQRLESDLAALRETLGERGGDERLSDAEAKTNPAGARVSQELHRTKRELLEVMRTLSSKNKELDAAQANLEEVGVLKAQNGQLAAECALQAATLCEQAQALVVLDRRLEGSCAELREKAATLSATEGAVAGLQAELAESRRELREERDRLEVARDAAEREASSRRDLAEVKAELANLLAQLGEARREAAEKIAELEEARVRLAELGQLKTQNEELFNKSMHQADTLKEVTEDCENLRKELEQCLKVLRDKRGEADERTEDNDLKAAQTKAGVELEETRSKLTETRQELERATRKYEEAQKELADVRARVNSGSGAGNFHRTMAALEERCERMAGQSDESESGVGTPRAEAPEREVKRLRELLAEHETASAEAKARESRLRREARMAQDALKAANRLMGEWEAKLAESKANVATASGQDGADRRCEPERTLAEKEEPESVALAEIVALERGAAEKESEGQVRAVPAGEEASAPVAGTDGRYRELIGASEATRAADVERLEATVAELTVEKEKLSFDLSALREANGVLCQELQVCEETMRTLESRLGAEETAERRAERARAEKAELEEELASVRAKLRGAAEESDDLREKLSDVRRQMQHVEKEMEMARAEKERSARLEQELEKELQQEREKSPSPQAAATVAARVEKRDDSEPVVTPVDSRWKEAQRELTSQLKEAEFRRNVEVKRWAAEREKLQKQIQEVESKKEQELRAWREERDLLATGLASEFDSLRTALAERDAEISCLNAVVAANAAAKAPGETEGSAAEPEGAPCRTTELPPRRTSAVRRRREEEVEEGEEDKSLESRRGRNSKQPRLACHGDCNTVVLDRSDVSVDGGGHVPRFPPSQLAIHLTPLKQHQLLKSSAKVPSRQKASDEGRSGSRLMKLRSKAQLKGSCEQDGGASGEAASASTRLGAGKGGGDTGATGPMQRIGDFLQSSPTRLKSCAKQIASTFKSAEAVNAAAADGAKTPPPLGKRKCKRKLLKLEISSPMDFSSHTFVDNKQQNVEKESDHSTIMRQLRRRKQ
ncbi:kinesin-like protein KIF20B isoform X2 [Lethenteron reissneri]|uniref:kinesin-like protein KIF20B isoform X2 n=1 Tax=Lethenteron reissneri TaxID=7753 RepID=UPI002AB7C9AE|nr:kinesin-like protein KIF20B isoform X2 [Lethenteron reissneri]